MLSCLFGGRRKFTLGEKKLGEFRRKVQFALSRSSVANSVGTPLEFAAFRNGLDAKYSRGRAFCFFFSVHNHGFCGSPNTFCQEKHQHFHVDRQLVTKKRIKY